MNLKEEALKYHLGGKIDIVPSKPMATSHDLSLAYSQELQNLALKSLKIMSLLILIQIRLI